MARLMTKQEYLTAYNKRFIELRGRKMVIQDRKWAENDYDYSLKNNRKKLLIKTDGKQN